MKEILKANQRIQRFVNKTPIVSSSLLNKWTGHEIYFKVECLQKIGAFKARGACNTVSWLVENNKKPKQIVANSSGNHAQAVAWASSQFGIPSKIYMPDYSSKVKIQATRHYGAEVELCKTRDIADKKVKEHGNEEGAFWIPPFNHLHVIAGQGTVTQEILSELDDVNAIFAPCGGGGLLSGTVIAAHGLSTKTKVYGAEPLNANDAAQSLKMNAIQRLQSVPDTLADGAMTMAVGDITFEYLKKLDGMYEIEETDMVYWTQWLTHLLKLHIEPTSALGMVAGFQWLKAQKTKKRIVVILSGGNIDQKTQSKIWEKSYLEIEPGI
ncbi:serine/threonine dehydratase [Maribacter sp. HTCC2170]|uniref:serine/threonine dehydratase n=1 Tax=Maribacter sp. (strain HTCC2170 / KCCM 42371) TaxID=313603 RepID=UPI00006B495E|nr:serine/threonine dehydratase [Maribacter sp. HTCC2170]EAR00990.1 Threonine dehydratase [Maribacter sp. HTCC2170]